MSMPLFRPCAAAAGYNNSQMALVLAAYILGTQPCYVFLGSVSDVVGRKPILLLNLFFALTTAIALVFFSTLKREASFFGGVSFSGCYFSFPSGTLTS